MNRKTAFLLAIGALQMQVKKVAVNANLHDIYRADTPVCVAASQKRERLNEAIEVLRKEMQK